jgi:hypothetical protein
LYLTRLPWTAVVVSWAIASAALLASNTDRRDVLSHTCDQ